MELKIGQRIRRVTRTGFPGFRDGAIVRIHGTQQADKVKALSLAVVFMQGDAKFDIFYDDGSRDLHVYERTLKKSIDTPSNGDYSLLPGIATAAELEFLHNAVKSLTEIRELAAATKAELRKAESERLIAEFPYLTPGDNATNGARNLRIELKRAFPETKFSVRKRSCTHSWSIDVEWTDGPTVKEVRAFSNKYQYADFDGMTDCDVHRDSVWGDVFGDARYVSETRNYSDDFVARAIAELIHEYGLNDPSKVPTVTDYRNGGLWKFECANYTNQFGKPMAFDDLIHRKLSNMVKCTATDIAIAEVAETFSKYDIEIAQ